MILKIEADDNTLGRVANAVKNKTKENEWEDFKSQEFLLPFSTLKWGIVGLFAKCVMPINFKRTTFDPFSIPRKALSYFFYDTSRKTGNIEICCSVLNSA